MNCLLKMRAQRDQMSVNERKLADFILDNIELLRDYSSQQLADAVGVSQSSVVKFSQKLGYRGYPSLKLAVYESYAGAMVAQAGDESARHFSGGDSPLSLLGQKKFEILENTTNINEAEQITEAIAAIRAARCIQVSACPGSVAVARYLTHQLLECGRWAIFDEGGKLQSPIANTLKDDDLLFIVCDLGGEESLVDVVNRAREQGAKVLSITRYNYNAASIHSDIRLYVAPAEGGEGWQRILFRAAQMHLIEGLIGGLIDQEG